MPIGAGNVQYSYAQLESIWNQAGGNPQAAPMAAAIAMAESGGNTAAYLVDTNGSTDRGLWQINSVHGSQSTFDVMANARAAVAISNNGNNWSPWTTYQTGAYRQFLKGSVPPDPNTPTNGTDAQTPTQPTQATTASFKCNWIERSIDPGMCLGLEGGQAIPGVGSALSGTEGAAAKIIMGIVDAIINPFIQLMAGVMGMAGGGIMVIGGIFLIVRQSETYQDTKQATGNTAGALAWLAGPEAGGAEMAAGSSARQTYRVGGFTTSRTQRGPRQPRPMSPEDQINAEANRYRAYSQAMDSYRKAGGRIQ